MFRLLRNGTLTIALVALVTGCAAPDGNKVETNQLADQQMRTETLAESHYFDGLDDYVEIAHSDDLLLDNGTLTLWFQADDLDGKQALFSKDSKSFDTGGHLNVALDGDKILVRMQSTKVSEYINSPAGSVTAGAWHYLALTWGPTGMKLYLDGELVGRDNYAGGLGRSSGGRGNFEPITLGASQRGSGDQVADNMKDFFAGSIKDVAFHDTALSAANVATLFQASDGGT